ncbi:MAG: hypothetical protein LCI00_22660 [Chloroflexi bacterium]|nr:hypothetical protein [Chloroflexota bacterium]MCC6895270.1 hypothetical protein [Anaerolineae bacterium]
MVTVHLSAIVDKDGQLTIKVPDHIPPGPINIIIESQQPASAPQTNPARETARTKLAAAGLLSSAYETPPHSRVPTDAEVEAAGTLPADARPSEELISEDRNEA